MKALTQKPVGHLPEISKIYQDADELSNALNNFDAVRQILLEDIEVCNMALRKNPKSQFWRRALIRCLFALVEGHVFSMKQIALSQYQVRKIQFTPAELTLLKEEKYMLGHEGEATMTQDNLKFVPNVRFSFTAFARAYGSSFQWDTSGFGLLKQLVQVRHSVTHPKRAKELTITDATCRLTINVWNWYSGESVRLFNDCLVNRNPVREVAEVVSRLEVQKPVILMCPNGDVFDFSTEAEMSEFVSANQDRRNIRRALAVANKNGEWHLIR